MRSIHVSLRCTVSTTPYSVMYCVAKMLGGGERRKLASPPQTHRTDVAADSGQPGAASRGDRHMAIR
jgi:hypothetical protein